MNSADKKPQLIILTALACEAKPLIDFYGLKKITANPFAHFQVEQEEFVVDLVVSGIGPLAMATAVGWAGAALIGHEVEHTGEHKNSKRNNHVAWLNVGTAGHATRPLGQAVLVNSSAGESVTRTFYPTLVCKWRGETESLLSVNAPSDQYPAQAAVDMEGQAFFNSAIRFTSAELVQSIKVISDNTDNGFELLNAQKLSDFIYRNNPEITAYASRLLDLLNQQPSTGAGFINAPSGLHFTVSQQHQWRDLSRKIMVMITNESIDLTTVTTELAKTSSAKQALAVLRSLLRNAAPQLKQNTHI